jgi:NADH:ubiquinone oxidoreductase subunit 2 (subunit N)
MVSAIGSAIIGCFGSLYQQGIKRLLAYTSISQVGFSFLGLICASLEGISASLLFFIVYIIVSVGIFAILINVEAYYKGGSLVYLSDLTNFSKYNISVALIFTIFLFSMAGIPPLGGFVSKLVIFASATGSYFYTFTIGIITISTVNVYVYVRMVKAMWSDILLVSKESGKESLARSRKKVLLYDIFIMSLPNNWQASTGKSFLFSCYQKLILFILFFIAFFVISFLFFFSEYTA